MALTVSSSVPLNASGLIDLSFTGFAFEQASWPQFASDEFGAPNAFSQNLISSVLSRTGGTPIIRVGGTSGDFGHLNITQSPEVYPVAVQSKPYTSPPYLSLGPSYFDSFKQLYGVQYILMVPLANNLTEMALNWAQLGITAIGPNLQAIELGNEPDLYRTFSPSSYAQSFLELQNAILSTTEGLPPNNTQLFQVIDGSDGRENLLSVQTAFDLGLDNGNTKTVAYHLYQGYDTNDGLAGLQSRIANHSAIAAKMYAYLPQIQYLASTAPGITFTLSEIGNTLGFGQLKRRNNLATVLWNIDMQLIALSIGVGRVNMQNMVFQGYSLWQPQPAARGTIPPAVYPNYYSQPFIADFIGPDNATRVAAYAVEGPDAQDTPAYAAYDGGRLARIAILNMRLWAQNVSTGARSSHNITVGGLPSATTSVTYQILTAPEGVYCSGDSLTWAGLNWSYNSSGLPVQVLPSNLTLPVLDGQVLVTIPDTSAVMLTLD